MASNITTALYLVKKNNTSKRLSVRPHPWHRSTVESSSVVAYDGTAEQGQPVGSVNDLDTVQATQINARYDCGITRVVMCRCFCENWDSHILVGVVSVGGSAAEWCEGGCIAPAVGTGGVSPASRADYQWSGASGARRYCGVRVPLSPAARPASADLQRLRPRLNLALIETGGGRR